MTGQAVVWIYAGIIAGSAAGLGLSIRRAGRDIAEAIRGRRAPQRPVDRSESLVGVLGPERSREGL